MTAVVYHGIICDFIAEPTEHRAWFQQDNAPVSKLQDTVELLNSFFENCICEWPTHSLDLDLPDFFAVFSKKDLYPPAQDAQRIEIKNLK